ncbi:MAG TPA: hypothetical protein DCE42_05250 [Myxococcales bacterium]|nr:hypothetical protein [Deltaproteobacteria bacterium]MBK07346.1 hypothetical protein [Deltaproteobacteria bacterium]MBU53529.1 hypothetical protein [Deltaproteobacteria bacterium]HAA54138.1 hypothetical protein [Myxococcales bacterium]
MPNLQVVTATNKQQRKGLIARITSWLQRLRGNVDVPEDLVVPGSDEYLTRLGSRRPELNHVFELFGISHDYQKAVSQCRRLSEQNPIFSAVSRKLTRTIGEIATTVTFDETKPQSEEASKVINDLLRRTLWNDKKEAFIKHMLNEGGLSFEVIMSSKRDSVDRIEYRPHNTIFPQVDSSGNVQDPTRAYTQIDPCTHAELATFALWQIVDVNLEDSYYHDRGIPHLQSSRQLLGFINLMTKGLMQKWVRESGSIEHFNLEEADKWEEIEKFKEINEVGLAASPENLVRQFFTKGKVSIERILADGKASANIDPADFMLELFFLAVGVPKEILGFKAHAVIRDMITVAIDNYYQLLNKIQSRLFAALRKLIDFELLLHGILPEDVPYRIEGGKFEQLRIPKVNEHAVKAGAVSMNELRKASGLPPHPHPFFDLPGAQMTASLLVAILRDEEVDVERYLDELAKQKPKRDNPTSSKTTSNATDTPGKKVES